MADLPLTMLTAYIGAIDAAINGAAVKAVRSATEAAYREAISRAKRQFNNTEGRVRSGELTTSINRRYDPETNTGLVSVGARYGAIQEFGGEVTPKNAAHLWVKRYVGVDTRFKRWTPRDFMAARSGLKKGSYGPARASRLRAARAKFFFMRDPHTNRLLAAYSPAKTGPAQVQILFALVDRVRVPSRPFIRPAVEAAVKSLPGLIKRFTLEADAAKAMRDGASDKPGDGK